MPSKILLTSIAAGAAFLYAVAAQAAQGGYYSGGELEDDTLPPDFRGRVTYQGTHEGSVTRAGPPLRGLRTRDIARSAIGVRTQQRAGAVTLEATFDGSAVTIRYSGTGMNAGSMTGTRNGRRCRLMDHTGGDWVEAECTRTRFASSSRSQRNRETITVRVEATATRLIDAAVEERDRAAAEAAAHAERQRRAAEQARLAAQERERLRNRPPPAAAPPRQEVAASASRTTQPRHSEVDQSASPPTQVTQCLSQAVNLSSSGVRGRIVDSMGGVINSDTTVGVVNTMETRYTNTCSRRIRASSACWGRGRIYFTLSPGEFWTFQGGGGCSGPREEE